MNEYVAKFNNNNNNKEVVVNLQNNLPLNIISVHFH